MRARVALVRVQPNQRSEPYIRFQLEQLRRYVCFLVSPSSWRFGEISRFAALLGICGAAPKLDVQLVHSHFGPDAQIGHALSRKNGVPHVVSLHGYDVTYTWLQYLKLKRLRFITYAFRRRRLLRRADLVLCCSEFLRTKAINRGARPAATRVHYLGVDIQAIDAALAEPVAERRFQHVVCVGRLVPVKGHSLLLQAMPALLRAFPDLIVTLVGTGPEMSRLQRLATRLGVSASVCFAGERDHDETLRVMRSADVVVVPSRKLGAVEEAFGLVAAEAMGLGIPVVATATGGLGEVLENGRLGLLVPDGSPQALAEAIESTLAAPDSGRIALASRTVRTRFDAIVQLRKLEDVLDAVANGNA